MLQILFHIDFTLKKKEKIVYATHFLRASSISNH